MTKSGYPHNVLDVEGLHIDLPVRRDLRRVIHDVTLSACRGEAIGLVGESGSGKSMTARAIMRLLPAGARVGGRIEVNQQNVNAMDRRALLEYRRQDVGMIYQDPRAHINPLRTIGDFLMEGPCDTRRTTTEAARKRVIQTLREVGINDAERRLHQYPHQLSGGLLQRVMIAAVLVAEPELMLADEPTTGLDVTTQQEVVAILDEQRRDRGMALVFITHDLDLALAITDRIAVMYAGSLAEVAPSADLHRTAIHPYTRALLRSRPRIDLTERMHAIAGRPISAYEVGPGCPFAGRCPHVQENCQVARPPLRRFEGQWVACHRAEELRAQFADPHTVAR